MSHAAIRSLATSGAIRPERGVRHMSEFVGVASTPSGAGGLSRNAGAVSLHARGIPHASTPPWTIWFSNLFSSLSARTKHFLRGFVTLHFGKLRGVTAQHEAGWGLGHGELGEGGIGASVMHVHSHDRFHAARPTTRGVPHLVGCEQTLSNSAFLPLTPAGSLLAP